MLGVNEKLVVHLTLKSGVLSTESPGFAVKLFLFSLLLLVGSWAKLTGCICADVLHGQHEVSTLASWKGTGNLN